MTTNPEKLFQDCMRAWNSHDVEKILSYYTDDVVYEDMAVARVMHGKSELRAFITEFVSGFPDFKIDPKSHFASGQWAGCEWVMSGTFNGALQSLGVQPTGKSFSVRGASIGELRGDKLRRNTDYYDGATLLRQIGVMP